MMSPAQPIVRRSRVSLAGRVVAANGAPAKGARLMLIRATVAEPEHVPAPREDIGRYTEVRGDGLYYFLDLPSGDYRLYWFDGGGQPVLQQSVGIAPGPGPKRFPMVNVELCAAGKPRERQADPAPRSAARQSAAPQSAAPRSAAPAPRRSSRGAARGDQNA